METEIIHLIKIIPIIMIVKYITSMKNIEMR